MKQATWRVGLYSKVVLTLIVILLAALLCKPFFITKPVIAYNTTADDAYYHADEALERAEEAYRYADEAYDYAGRAYYQTEQAHKEVEKIYFQARRAEERADEAYEKAEEALAKAKTAQGNANYYADNAYWRAKRDLSAVTELIWWMIRKNRKDLVKMGEKLEIGISSLEELMEEFEEIKKQK